MMDKYIFALLPGIMLLMGFVIDFSPEQNIMRLTVAAIAMVGASILFRLDEIAKKKAD